MTDDFMLSQAERDSVLWRRLMGHFKARREMERSKNDALLLDDRMTAATRGRIAAFNELIALDEPAPGVDP